MKIDEVILHTNNIQSQKQFYHTVLEFELIVNTPIKVSFKTGKSILTFEYRETFNTSHLAFNIPSNQIRKALNWLQKRVEILTFEGNLIADFKSWNAQAIYFYDADKNILEFIARKNLNIISEQPFSSTEVVSISEMAIATTRIENIYNAINAIKKIPIFSGNFSRFCAIGNDEGLFILVNKNEKKWFPTMEKAYTSDFIIKGDYNFAFENGKIKELS